MIPSKIGGLTTTDLGFAKSSSTEHEETPGIPAPNPLANLYTLHCIRNAPHVMSKTFQMQGSMQDIIAKCKNYCEQMRYRFLRVEPFLTNLAEDLRKNSGDSSTGTNQY